MNIDEAISVIEALSSGCDPQTGEELDSSQLLRRSDIAEALTALIEAIHIIRGTLTVSESEGINYSPKESEFSDKNAYEAVKDKFGAIATGGPSRFNKPGWFYIGPAVIDCPECKTTVEAFRKPYKTKAGIQYHYWALFCPTCQKLFEPKSLGDKRKEIYASSELRPSDYNDDQISLSEELADYEEPKKQTNKLTSEEWKYKNIANARPAKSFFPWTEEDKAELIRQYNMDPNIAGLASQFERSKLAIAIQLEKAGLISKERVSDLKDLDKHELGTTYPRENECLDCDCEIPEERLKETPGAQRCLGCQDLFEKNHPDSVKRTMQMEEGLVGSREDHNDMRRRIYGDIRRRNYE